MFGARRSWIAPATLLVAAVLAACTATSTTSTSPTSAPAAGGAATTAAAPKPGAAMSGKLTIAGSSALQPLVDQAAKNFQSTNKDVQITVSAGGSGAGRT